MTIFLTADLHLDHEAIIGYTGRPFHSAGEMNGVLIGNILETVRLTDTLYVLGDFAFKEPTFKAYRAMLKEACDVLFVHGNHDSKKWAGTDPLALDFKWNHRHYYVTHFPFATWTPNTVHLHGHCHGNELPLPHDSRLRWRYDVGVDTEWDGRKYFPVSIDQIEKRMKGIE